jgi:hypothetical protein
MWWGEGWGSEEKGKGKRMEYAESLTLSCFGFVSDTLHCLVAFRRS